MPRSERTKLGKAFGPGLAISMLQKDKGLEHVDLVTGGWVDLRKADRLAQWSATLENLGKREFALYRTAKGTLILKDPVGRKRVALALGMLKTPFTTSVQYEFREVSPAEAAAVMAENGASRDAEKLFPEEMAEHRVRVRDDER